MKKAKCTICLLLAIASALLCSCRQKNGAQNESRTIADITITYHNGPLQTQLQYTSAVKMRAILNYLRWIDPYGKPTEDPELVDGHLFQIVVAFSDGSRETVTPVLEQAPGLNVILAHPGEPWGPTGAKGRFQFVSEYANLYMDISGYGLFRWNMLRYAVDVCGPEKIIFGSDMPTCSAGMYLYGALSENMTDDEFRLILGGNFRRLLGMKK